MKKTIRRTTEREVTPIPPLDTIGVTDRNLTKILSKKRLSGA